MTTPGSRLVALITGAPPGSVSPQPASFTPKVTLFSSIDRLVHHSVILELNLPSYRMEAAQKRKAAKGGDGSTEIV